MGTGFMVVYGILTWKWLDSWTTIFLATTVLTSLTGLLFPVEHIVPSHVVGAMLLVVLAVAILSGYVLRLEGASRWVYVVCAVWPFI